MIRQLIVITDDMTRGNESARVPGRVEVTAQPCLICRRGHVWQLGIGSWAVEHSCLTGWKMQRLPGSFARAAAIHQRIEADWPRRSEVNALAAELASALAGAR